MSNKTKVPYGVPVYSVFRDVVDRCIRPAFTRTRSLCTNTPYIPRSTLPSDCCAKTRVFSSSCLEVEVKRGKGRTLDFSAVTLSSWRRDEGSDLHHETSSSFGKGNKRRRTASMASFGDGGGGFKGGGSGASGVFVGSFNINSQDLSSEAARAWLKEAEDADIVALGLQVQCFVLSLFSVVGV